VIYLSGRGRKALIASDRSLAACIAKVGPLRMEVSPPSSVYESLARAIVYQQLSGKAAGTIYGRVQALGGGELPEPGALLSLSDEVLRAAGLSGGKTKAMRDLAQHVIDEKIPTLAQALLLSDNDLIEQLTVVRGIGAWSVQMFLMFRLGRPDLLPSNDLGIRKGYQRVFRTKTLPLPATIDARGQRWAPVRTMASWYLWRASEWPA
jgi:DNA-3-methyladenine glycosylase II